MKRILGLLLCMFMFTPAQAQNEPAKKSERWMSVSVSPLAALGAGVDVMYQVKLLDFLALTVPVNYYYPWIKASIGKFAVKFASENLGVGSMSKSPYEIEGGIGARFLLSNRGLSDTFYLEPRILIGYQQFGIEFDKVKCESQSLNMSALLRLGWDWYWESGFYMSLGGGLGLKYYIDNKRDLTGSRIPEDNWIVNFIFPSESQKLGLAYDGEFKLGYSW